MDEILAGFDTHNHCAAKKSFYKESKERDVDLPVSTRPKEYSYSPLPSPLSSRQPGKQYLNNIMLEHQIN